MSRKHWQKIKKTKLIQRLSAISQNNVFGSGLLSNRLFQFIVILPVAFAVLYFGLYASDVYIAESRFVVRSPKSAPSSNSIGALLSTVGVSKADEDTYVVTNFITSMGALREVDRSINLKQVYSDPKIDLFSRFASFNWNESYERLLLYFNDHVEISVDPQSSIAALKVRAYTPESAQKINQMLLESSENLVNSLNEQARNDLIQFASHEVEVAKGNLERVDAALIKMRNQKVTDDTTNFVPKFQALSLERDTAEKQLSSAIASVEQARIDAQRKRLYVERISEPTLPDYPMEPKRIKAIATVILFSLVVWGVATLLVASIKEHHD